MVSQNNISQNDPSQLPPQLPNPVPPLMNNGIPRIMMQGSPGHQPITCFPNQIQGYSGQHVGQYTPLFSSPPPTCDSSFPAPLPSAFTPPQMQQLHHQINQYQQLPRQRDNHTPVPEKPMMIMIAGETFSTNPSARSFTRTKLKEKLGLTEDKMEEAFNLFLDIKKDIKELKTSVTAMEEIVNKTDSSVDVAGTTLFSAWWNYKEISSYLMKMEKEDRESDSGSVDRCCPQLNTTLETISPASQFTRESVCLTPAVQAVPQVPVILASQPISVPPAPSGFSQIGETSGVKVSEPVRVLSAPPRFQPFGASQVEQIMQSVDVYQAPSGFPPLQATCSVQEAQPVRASQTEPVDQLVQSNPAVKTERPIVPSAPKVPIVRDVLPKSAEAPTVVLPPATSTAPVVQAVDNKGESTKNKPTSVPTKPKPEAAENALKITQIASEELSTYPYDWSLIERLTDMDFESSKQGPLAAEIIACEDQGAIEEGDFFSVIRAAGVAALEAAEAENAGRAQAPGSQEKSYLSCDTDLTLEDFFKQLDFLDIPPKNQVASVTKGNQKRCQPTLACRGGDQPNLATDTDLSLEDFLKSLDSPPKNRVFSVTKGTPSKRKVDPIAVNFPVPKTQKKKKKKTAKVTVSSPELELENIVVLRTALEKEIAKERAMMTALLTFYCKDDGYARVVNAKRNSYDAHKLYNHEWRRPPFKMLCKSRIRKFLDSESKNTNHCCNGTDKTSKVNHKTIFYQALYNLYNTYPELIGEDVTRILTTTCMTADTYVATVLGYLDITRWTFIEKYLDRVCKPQMSQPDDPKPSKLELELKNARAKNSREYSNYANSEFFQQRMNMHLDNAESSPRSAFRAVCYILLHNKGVRQFPPRELGEVGRRVLSFDFNWLSQFSRSSPELLNEKESEYFDIFFFDAKMKAEANKPKKG